MEIEIALNKSDLLVLAQYQVKYCPQVSQRAKKRRWGYTIGFLLLALGTYFILGDMFLTGGFGLLAIVSAVFYPYLHQRRVQRHIERLVEKRSKPESFAKRKLGVTAEGLEEESEYAASKVKWHLVDGIDITPGNTFISIEGVYSVIIPKASVKSGDYDEFVRSVREYTENKTAVE